MRPLITCCPVVAVGALRRGHVARGWGNLGWPEVGKFDRPTGKLSKLPNRYPTVAKAILDLIVHRAHAVSLKEESMLKLKAKKINEEQSVLPVSKYYPRRLQFFCSNFQRRVSHIAK